MKTKFYYLPILLLGGLSLFTACSDDDDENGGGQPSAPVIGPSGTNSGARLTSISDDDGYVTYFHYNEDGTIKRIFDVGSNGKESDWISMTYNPFRIETEEYGFLKNISFNNNGYLTRLAFEYSESDEEGGWSETGKYDMQCTYNSNENPTKITFTGSYRGKEDGDSYSGEDTFSITYSWIEGNLAKIQQTYNNFKDGESFRHTETYEFEYSEEVNKFQQYITGLEVDGTDFLEYFAPIGWYGKWSKNYPASVVYKWIEESSEGKYEETYTKNWSNFSTTNDGLLSGFNYNGTRYTYTYDNTAPTAKKAAAKQMLDNNASSPRTKKMGRHHLRHARMLNRK